MGLGVGLDLDLDLGVGPGLDLGLGFGLALGLGLGRENNMNCPKCSTTMIKAKATDFGEEYFYCRSCKKELSEINKEDEVSYPLFNASNTSPYTWGFPPNFKYFMDGNILPIPCDHDFSDVTTNNCNSCGISYIKYLAQALNRGTP